MAESGRWCVSEDGALLGSVIGIHRDPATRAARWAVLDSGDPQRRFLLVPLQRATTQSDGLHVPYSAAQVRSGPPVDDPTRMRESEEAQLAAHYRGATPVAAAAPVVPAAPVDDAALSMVRHEEQLGVTGLEWRPYQRLRVRRVVHTEEVTEVVTVRREELVVEDEPITAFERLEATYGTATPPPPEDIEMVLHREEVVVQKRIVPYERVRIHTDRVAFDHSIEGTVRKERIDVEREPIRKR